MSKVKVDVLRPWISKRVEDLLGMEDDVVEEFVVNQLEANQVRKIICVLLLLQSNIKYSIVIKLFHYHVNSSQMAVEFR